MRRWGLVAAILLVILTNAVLFARLAYNRAGEPEATIVVTGREIYFKADQSEQKEKSGRTISIKLDWNRTDEHPWLDQAKLEALGFDLPLPSYVGEGYYWNPGPRKAYVVLEYDGEAYKAWRRKMEERIAKMEEEEKEGKSERVTNFKAMLEIKRFMVSAISDQSRLFPVNAGTDPVALRRQYPDRHRFIIAAAEVSVYFSPGHWNANENGKKYLPPSFKGYFSDLLVSPIYLSDQQRDQLEKIIPRLKPAPGEEVRFPPRWQMGGFLPKTYNEKEIDPRKRALVRFTICYGRNYEPWVADIRLEGEAK
jgi:hypothetical protein